VYKAKESYAVCRFFLLPTVKWDKLQAPRRSGRLTLESPTFISDRAEVGAWVVTPESR